MPKQDQMDLILAGLKASIAEHAAMHQRIDLHINFDNELNIHGPDGANNKLLNLILQNTILIMAKQDQMDLILAGLKTSISEIAARIQAFIDAGSDNVTQASMDELQADADALKDLGTTPSTAV